ncbi:MAG: 3-phosphoshikimate 1-carboxyvinyltransferase [Bdellovibrionota bacterium]
MSHNSSASVSLRGSVAVPGDKSITHRAVMFGAVAEGRSVVTTSTLGRDNFATLRIMRQLGVELTGKVNSSLVAIAHEEGLPDFTDSGTELCHLTISGRGFDGLKAPKDVLNCGNSGTTARLLTGLLAGRPFASTFDGDHSLVKRPFKRVVDPLSQMGASFTGDKLPFTMNGGNLKGISYTSPHASAQVKSAILLAGLQATGDVSVTEPRLSRDHTERMLSSMGCAIRSERQPNGSWTISLPSDPNRGRLKPSDVTIPGDFSAAAFFMVAGSIFPESDITILNVGVNPTRTGLFNVLKRMGANIELLNARQVGGEEVVDMRVRSANLQGVEVEEDDVVLGIDEMPILSVAAAAANGKTIIRGAAELRVKESDRLAMSTQVLRTFGVQVEEFADGMTVTGSPTLAGLKYSAAEVPEWKQSGDHRIAMCGAILELLVTGRFDILDMPAVETSFPSFARCLEQIIVPRQ